MTEGTNERINKLFVRMVYVRLSRFSADVQMHFKDLCSFVHLIFIHLSPTEVFTDSCHHIFKFSRPSVFIIQAYTL